MLLEVIADISQCQLVGMAFACMAAYAIGLVIGALCLRKEQKRLIAELRACNRQFTDLSGQMDQSQQTIRHLRQQLEQLDQTLARVEQRSKAGIGRLRIDARGELVEDGQT